MLWDLGVDAAAAMARAEGGIVAAWAALRASAADQRPRRDGDGAVDSGLSVPWRWQLEDPTIPTVAPCRVLDASPHISVASRAVAFGPGGDTLLVALENGAVQRWNCVAAAPRASRAPAAAAATAAYPPHPASAQTPQMLRELQVR